MIWNVNLLYIEWFFRFLKRHTLARALVRAKTYWNWLFFQKNSFFHDFKEHYGIYIFFNFHLITIILKCKYVLHELIVPVFLTSYHCARFGARQKYWSWCFSNNLACSHVRIYILQHAFYNSWQRAHFQDLNGLNFRI